MKNKGWGPCAELPIAWRVWWLQVNGRPFDKSFRPKPQHKTYSTKEQAEREKRLLAERFGPEAAVHVTPVYISRTKREQKLVAAQDSLTRAGWPIQSRPPRPSSPSRKLRRSWQ